jgi:S1-C subfamily serine protease
LSKIPEEILNEKDYNLVKVDIKKAIENSEIYYRIIVNNKKYYICDIVNSSKELDITLLKVKEKQYFKPALMGNSNLIKVGGNAIAIGYLFATFFFEIFKDLKPTMTLGTISAIRTDNWGIQHTASINSGNYGGPLLNKNGQVIGINVDSFSDTNAMFFSIPINKVKSWLSNNNLGNIIE